MHSTFSNLLPLDKLSAERTRKSHTMLKLVSIKCSALIPSCSLPKKCILSRDVMVKMAVNDFDVSSNSGNTITFTFGLIGDVWSPYSPIYGLNSIPTVFLQGYLWD